MREALEDAIASISAAKKVGNKRVEALAHQCACYFRLQLRGYANARADAERAMSLVQQIGSQRFEANGWCLLAMVCHWSEHRDDAKAAIDKALAIITRTGTSYIGPTVYAVLPLAEEDPGRRKAALAERTVSHNHYHFRRDA
jgi:hypothetical protein